MNTYFALSAQYDGRVVIPVDEVARDFFNLKPLVFLRKVETGTIKLPIIRMEASQKSAKGVDVRDLADYLDARRAEAQREMVSLHS